MAYHSGEIEVQERAGVRSQAREVGEIVAGAIAPGMRPFLARRRLLFAGGAAPGSEVWATVLHGPPGFLSVPDLRRLAVAAVPHAADPFTGVLREGAPVGLLVMDFERRIRIRLNGIAEPGEHGFALRLREAYGNCNQYIQRRSGETMAEQAAGETPVPQAMVSMELSPAQSAWIGGADTFFIASVHPEAGADVSHRGGRPGFIHIEDNRKLRWPDYSGNNMFNSLGNLAVNPNSGLLFVDFTLGHILQLSGRATVLWQAEARSGFPGAQRVLEFEIATVCETRHALPLHLELVEYSPTLP